VVVTLTDARTELSGTLQTGESQPAMDYYMVAMSADRTMWRPRSRRVLSARPATDGRFVFAHLPAGEYLLIALTDLDPIELGDPAFLEQLAPAGVKVTRAEGRGREEGAESKDAVKTMGSANRFIRAEPRTLAWLERRTAQDA